MFDPTKGKAASSAQIDHDSDLFAADFEAFLKNPSVPRVRKEQLIRQFRDVMADPTVATSFAEGTYAQANANNGSPAQALGSGSNGTTPKEALQIVLSAPDSEVPAGSKALLRRALVPGDPDHIVVDQNGSPVLIDSLRHKLQQVEGERDNAQQQLADQKNDTVAGSLAKQLKDMTTERDNALGRTAPLPTDMVKKGDVKTALDKLRPVGTAKQAVRSNHAVVSMTPTDLKAAYDAVQAIVS